MDEPKTDKAATLPIGIGHLTPSDRKTWLAVYFAVAVFGMGIILFSPSAPNQHAPSLWRTVGVVIVLTGGPIANYVVSRLTGAKIQNDGEDPFVNRVLRLAKATKSHCGGVDLIESPGVPLGDPIARRNGRITIERDAVDQLSPDEVDFGIAYALLERQYRLNLWLLLIGVSISTLWVFTFGLMMTPHRSTGEATAVLLLAMFAPALVFYPLFCWFVRLESKRRIRLALSVVPNREAARGWVGRSIWTPTVSYFSTIGRISYRQGVFDQIDQVSLEMGLS